MTDNNNSQTKCDLVSPGLLEKKVTLPKVSPYLVTIKRNTMEYTSKDTLDNQLIILVKKCKNMEWSDIVAYEEDSLRRMHLHTAVMITGRAPLFKRYQVPGFTIHFQGKKTGSYNRILRYILKFKQSKQDYTKMFMLNEAYWIDLKFNPMSNVYRETGLHIRDLFD